LNWPTKLVTKGCEFKATPEQEQDGLLSGSNIASKTTSMDGPNSKPNAINLELLEGRT
jgi:hypothetical protein